MEFAKKVKIAKAVEAAPSLIDQAKQKQQKEKISNVEWSLGSVLNLIKQFPNEKFDKIITKRVLINLNSWEDQKKAISQIVSLIKTKKLFLMAEGFTDSFRNLQNLRVRFGLERDTIVRFNLYFDRTKFENYIKKYFDIIEQNNFGVYYFLSHFYYPLYIKPQRPQYSSKMNQVATKIALKTKLLEEYGYINFYALRKKS